MPDRIAQFLGFDLSTTALSVGVRGTDGDEDFVGVNVRGATHWHGQPGFLTDYLPLLLTAAVWRLQDRGWKFTQPGSLSFSVRQHDMIVMDAELRPLIPALSWECHVAQPQVAALVALGVDQVVGPIAARFILPKLMWALQQEPDLVERVSHVATTGDYVGACLTGRLRLSASDALSNALLDQQSKQLAADAISKTSVQSGWFPEVVGSGQPVGKVDVTRQAASGWRCTGEVLDQWTVAAGLGDNHAGAVGCGLSDGETIVISAGSSGTVVRMCPPTARLAGKANCFEYYDDRLLLLMLADCALWYNRFRHEQGLGGREHDELNHAAGQVAPVQFLRVRQEVRDGKTVEIYPDGWHDLDWPVRVASTQFSIALELLLLVRDMLVEVQDGHAPVRYFVLTGGLCQSPLLRSILYCGLRQLSPSAEIFVSARTDRLAFQSATYGAVINAVLLGEYARLGETIQRLCPRAPCQPPDAHQREAIADCLQLCGPV